MEKYDLDDILDRSSRDMLYRNNRSESDTLNSSNVFLTEIHKARLTEAIQNVDSVVESSRLHKQLEKTNSSSIINLTSLSKSGLGALSPNRETRRGIDAQRGSQHALGDQRESNYLNQNSNNDYENIENYDIRNGSISHVSESGYQSESNWATFSTFEKRRNPKTCSVSRSHDIINSTPA
jgi:hypothetical protein